MEKIALLFIYPFAGGRVKNGHCKKCDRLYTLIVPQSRNRLKISICFVDKKAQKPYKTGKAGHFIKSDRPIWL